MYTFTKLKMTSIVKIYNAEASPVFQECKQHFLLDCKIEPLHHELECLPFFSHSSDTRPEFFQYVNPSLPTAPIVSIASEPWCKSGWSLPTSNACCPQEMVPLRQDIWRRDWDDPEPVWYYYCWVICWWSWTETSRTMHWPCFHGIVVNSSGR